MKLTKLYFLLNLLFVVVSFSALAQNSEYPDTLALRELFINKNFEQLTSKIATYQKRYEEDITHEIAF